jgi:7-cyano-7-deazaguanine reductase
MATQRLPPERPSALATGTRATEPGKTRPSRRLDIFPNPNAKRDFVIHLQIEEFTCLCPLTGQPDFARLEIDYIPDGLCVELKSLKLYMWSFREQGAFHEAVTNQILDDLVAALGPRFMRVVARWNVRGGIFTNVQAEHRKPKWKPMPRVDLGAFEPQSPNR